MARTPAEAGGGGRSGASEAEVRRAIDAVWRIESPRLIAGLARRVGDVGLAEDLAQDALLAALEQWPASGIPRNPGAWLMTAGKRRGIDHIRRASSFREKEPLISHELTQRLGTGAADPDAVLDDPLGDDLLRLIFICCHPVLLDLRRGSR